MKSVYRTNLRAQPVPMNLVHGHGLIYADGTIESQIELKEREVLTYLAQRDFEAYGKLLDNRFIGIGVFGVLYNRAEFITYLSMASNIRRIALEDTKIIVEPGFAIAVSDWAVDMTQSSAIFNGLIRTSRVWVRRSNGWKMLSLHTADARVGEAWKAIHT